LRHTLNRHTTITGVCNYLIIDCPGTIWAWMSGKQMCKTCMKYNKLMILIVAMKPSEVSLRCYQKVL